VEILARESTFIYPSLIAPRGTLGGINIVAMRVGGKFKARVRSRLRRRAFDGTLFLET